MTPKEFTKLCVDLEHFETCEWPLDEILKRELMTRVVLDPCAGTGIMAEKAKSNGYDVISMDIHDWGYEHLHHVRDYTKMEPQDLFRDFSVFMNPPFKRTCEFVEKSFELGARKIIMFQRWAFGESIERKGFFEKYPLARMYLCASRAPCWRHDIQPDEKGHRYDPVTEKKLSSSPTPYAFFIWERGQEQTAPPTFKLYK